MYLLHWQTCVRLTLGIIISIVSAHAASAQLTQASLKGSVVDHDTSQRAMLRVPTVTLPWRAYTTAVREKEAIGRDIKLHVSFAVSVLNDCRYCTLHQVLGLRRLGVDPAKLLAMRKDDSALTPRELVAVQFARALTTRPGGVKDDEYAALVKEFGDVGAQELLIQTCNFAFMNRFTDGLMLPSEDEAIRVYQEIYGPTSTR